VSNAAASHDRFYYAIFWPTSETLGAEPLQFFMQSNVFTHITRSADETRQFGQSLARALHPGDLVTLSGELGAGKTTFVQGLVRAFDSHDDAVSPTFVLATEYSGRAPLIHIDAYRLEGADYETLRDTGVPDSLERRDAVKLVEWPECIAPFLPEARFQVRIEHLESDGEYSHDARRITVEGAGFSL
jgi:tRNA threonylcarbamoyladenosine biosynthesis protein TsaE